MKPKRTELRRVLVLYGTRPEAIKMAPVIDALRREGDRLEVVVCTTAQHREMLDQVQELFGLRADIDLNLMRPNQGLNQLASSALAALDVVLRERRPHWVLVQGDTTTAMAGALAGFHAGIRVGHVEAGLRTGDLKHPFPEEANRRIIDMLSDALFAPTRRAEETLLAEGIERSKVFLTGNTVVDALQQISQRLPDEPQQNLVLITAHRRESFGAPLRRILEAVKELARRFPDTRWIYPVHRNPQVLGPAQEVLSNLPNVELHPPFDYLELVRRMRTCRFVLTDSGGIQEEAPTFGKPVLILRETTERPEGVEAGVALLVGTDWERIIKEASALLSDPGVYSRMSNASSPYGDGKAGARIAEILNRI